MYIKTRWISLALCLLFSQGIGAMESKTNAPIYRCPILVIWEHDSAYFLMGLIDQGPHLALPSFVQNSTSSQREQAKNYLASLKIFVAESDIHPIAHFEAIKDGQKYIDDVVGVRVSSNVSGLVFGTMGQSDFFFPNAQSLHKSIENLAWIQQLQLVVHHGLQGRAIDQQIKEKFELVIKSYEAPATGYFTIDPETFAKEYAIARKKHSGGCVLF